VYFNFPVKNICYKSCTVTARQPLPDLEQLDPVALKTLLLAQHEQLLSHENEIAHLKLLIAKVRHMQFGRSWEKLDRQIEQLELRLEELQVNDAEIVAGMPVKIASVEPVARSVRRSPPAHLPRDVRTHLPKQEACPDCGGKLRKLGEDVSEVLECMSSRFQVIRHVRVRLACACCERIVETAAPSRPIERGLAGPGLLAHVLVSKYGDHLPLYRQSEIYTREGVGLDRSMLADWVGGSSRLFEPSWKRCDVM